MPRKNRDIIPNDLYPKKKDILNADVFKLTRSFTKLAAKNKISEVLTSNCIRQIRDAIGGMQGGDEMLSNIDAILLENNKPSLLYALLHDVVFSAEENRRQILASGQRELLVGLFYDTNRYLRISLPDILSAMDSQSNSTDTDTATIIDSEVSGEIFDLLIYPD